MSKFFTDAGVQEFTGVFRGDGVNHEDKPFQAQFIGEPILGGQAFRIQFVAHDSNGNVFHEEETVLSPEALGGMLKMYTFNTNTQLTVLSHVKKPEGPHGDKATLLQFSTENLKDKKAFRSRITLRRAGVNALEYAFEWGMPGGEFASRSAVVLKRN